MMTDLPVFGVCGLSGSGKTTLIEHVVARLVADGLRVGVVKNAGEIQVDRPGKDSDRLFEAGADVLLTGTAEQLGRSRCADGADWAWAASEMAETCDLVLVEGHKEAALPKVWLLRRGEHGPPEGIENVRAVLGWECDRPASLLGILTDYAAEQWRAAPMYGCVLIGGSSRRMGRPKHLLTDGGKSWLARTADLLGRQCEQVVVAGAGELPDDAGRLTRLADVADAEGPMSGLLAAMRWAPRACWLVAACDLPNLSAEALDWLAGTRKVGVWAALPRMPGADHVEPLPAFYDFRCRRLLEDMARCADFRLTNLAGREKVISPTPPAELVAAWRNVNTPEDIA